MRFSDVKYKLCLCDKPALLIRVILVNPLPHVTPRPQPKAVMIISLPIDLAILFFPMNWALSKFYIYQESR